jgi:DnaK suppressor protein
MAKKVQKKPAKSVAGKAKKAAKPAPKPAAKKAPASKKASPVAKKPASKPAPAAKKPVAKAPVKVVAKKPVAVSKPVEVKKPVAVKVPAKVEVKAERPFDPRREVTIAKPLMKLDKGDPRSRYSDKELMEFKDLINKKLEEATRDYELLKNTLSHKDDHGTDDTSPTFKLLEDGSDVLSKEETAHLASRQEKYIQNLKNALIRIENKTYGICRVTGRLIPKERLRSVPHATLSIDAKLEQNR